MKFSEKIVYMRKMRKISQDRLAKKMGVSRQTIYKWEADLNTPEFNKIEKLAEILNVSYNMLLDDNIDLEEYFKQKEINQVNQNETETKTETEIEITTKVESCEEPKAENRQKKSSKRKTVLLISVVSFLALIIIFALFLFVGKFLNNILEYIDTETNTDTSTDSSNDTSLDTTLDTVVYVYFDAKEGELEEKSRKIVKGEKIGELPIPTKDNFTFVGWENSYGTRIDKNATVNVDIILYAVYEDQSNTVSLTLNPNGGEVNKTKITVSKDTYIQDYLPTPTHKDSLMFLGWFDEKGIKIMSKTKLSSNQTLIAYWDALEICPNTKTEHQFGTWNYNKMSADCENDGYATRTCHACYYEERKITENALGHDYNATNYEVMSEWSECKRCGHVKTMRYINLNDTCIGNTMIEGNILGREYYYAVFDGEFDSFIGPGCAENEEMTFYIYLKEYTYIDCIFTQGKGEMDFTISVITPPEMEYVQICSGSFKDEVQRFEINKYVLAIKIHTNNAEGHWQEIALAQIPKEEK